MPKSWNWSLYFCIYGILSCFVKWKMSYTCLTASVSRTTWVTCTRKVKPIWILMGWQWHQLDHMLIICTSFQTDNPASTSSLKFFTGRMLFLTPSQQCQSTEGKLLNIFIEYKFLSILSKWCRVCFRELCLIGLGLFVSAKMRFS